MPCAVYYIMSSVAFCYYWYCFFCQLTFVYPKCGQGFRYFVAVAVGNIPFHTADSRDFYHFWTGYTVGVNTFSMSGDGHTSDDSITKGVNDRLDAIASNGIYSIATLGIGSDGYGPLVQRRWKGCSVIFGRTRASC